jgi:hypothetical protein
MLVMEPAAQSTRTLLASGSATEQMVPPPDPEEKRLSHELDFGETERLRRSSESGGGRRLGVILVLLIILAGIVAVVFETQITAAAPALKPIYAQLGL